MKRIIIIFLIIIIVNVISDESANEKQVSKEKVTCESDACQHIPTMNDMINKMQHDVDRGMKEKKQATENGEDNILPAKKGDMRILFNWATPLFETNLGDWGIDVAKLNARIATDILTDYNEFVQKHKSISKHENLADSQKPGLNNVFYEWQMHPKRNLKLRWRNSKEYQQLLEIIYQCLDYYLAEAGVDPDAISKVMNGVDPEPWATVHSEFVSHGAHFHEGCIASAVYYVKVPEDAGVIEFMDPRGPRPPFDNSRLIKPKTGDLVIFPSWLQHQVHPTKSNETRISIPHNFAGRWKHTTDLHKTQDIPVKKFQEQLEKMPLEGPDDDGSMMEMDGKMMNKEGYNNDGWTEEDELDVDVGGLPPPDEYDVNDAVGMNEFLQRDEL